MSIPILIERDYKMKAEENVGIDRFESSLQKTIYSLQRSSDPKMSHIDVSFSSFKEIGEIREEMIKTLDFKDIKLMYDTLDYEEDYTGEKYFSQYYRGESHTLLCDSCRDLNPSKIHKGERLPVCDECLCSCSEFTHKGPPVPVEKMRVLNVGGISFRVCEECIPAFTS